MPTDIYFGGENVHVTVEEEPGQVAEAFASADGLPFRLTTAGGHLDVYVNPSMVAFWLGSEPGREFEPPSGPPEQSPQRKKEGEAFTYNIWGRTVPRRPRR